MAEGKGQGGLALLVLLVLVVGLGGYNYHRNWQREQAEQTKRTFSGYATADLEQLAAAYRAEAEALQKRYSAASRRVAPARDRAFMSDRVAEFERVQKQAGSARDVATLLAEREARVREIEQELALRQNQTGALAVHFRRLISF
ncbi:MAG: hypothetical protein MJE66_19610 [Proteobacteria bacterium]|nr:hypothetical protein [Pseudomonadota bacterium]